MNRRREPWPLRCGDQIDHCDYGDGHVVEVIRIADGMMWVRAKFIDQQQPRSILVLPPGGPGSDILRSLNGVPYVDYAVNPGDESRHNGVSQPSVGEHNRSVQGLSARYAGPLYFMPHIDNLGSILAHGIHSLNYLLRKGIAYRSIADENVQSLRDRIYVVDSVRRRNLHDYVPLYFVARTPMMYRRLDVQDDIVYIEIAPDVLDLPGVVVTDGNASAQGLQALGSSTVDVLVATNGKEVCRRRYRPEWVRATGRSMSDMFAGPQGLDRLAWEAIHSLTWAGNDELKRQKHAEALIPNHIPPRYFRSVHVRTARATFRVEQEAARHSVSIPVCVSRQLYFQEGRGQPFAWEEHTWKASPEVDLEGEEAAWADALARARDFSDASDNVPPLF